MGGGRKGAAGHRSSLTTAAAGPWRAQSQCRPVVGRRKGARDPGPSDDWRAPQHLQVLGLPRGPRPRTPSHPSRRLQARSRLPPQARNPGPEGSSSRVPRPAGRLTGLCPRCCGQQLPRLAGATASLVRHQNPPSPRFFPQSGHISLAESLYSARTRRKGQN